MNAVDTNVLVYAFDADEPAKQAKAIALLDGLTQPPAETLLLWQVAGEFLSCLRRWENTGRVSAADVDSHIMDAMNMLPLALPSRRVIEVAIDFKCSGLGLVAPTFSHICGTGRMPVPPAGKVIPPFHFPARWRSGAAPVVSFAIWRRLS